MLTLLTFVLCAAGPAQVESKATICQSGIVLDVISDTKLDSPKISREGRDLPLYPPCDLGGRWKYRVKAYLPLEPKNVVLQYNSEDAINLVMLKLPEFEFQTTVQCEAPRPIRDIGLAIINRYRAARGLKPMEYDPEYARISRVNNEMGGVHRYTGGAMQTWASPSDPESAVEMWMGDYYSSHGAMLMNPNVTRGGTHSHSTAGTTWSGG